MPFSLCMTKSLSLRCLFDKLESNTLDVFRSSRPSRRNFWRNNLKVNHLSWGDGCRRLTVLTYLTVISCIKVSSRDVRFPDIGFYLYISKQVSSCPVRYRAPATSCNCNISEIIFHSCTSANSEIKKPSKLGFFVCNWCELVTVFLVQDSASTLMAQLTSTNCYSDFEMSWNSKIKHKKMSG